MKPFDILNSPLTGTHLIEASAGTGKTYTMEGVFVRLILERHLSVDQILVVTFTNTAAEELKNRIRNKLVTTKEHFKGVPVDDAFIRSLINISGATASAIDRINNAIIDFDQAAICTIHGFCQRIIHEQAFETYSDFFSDILPDQSVLIREIANDYWRMNVYNTQLEIVSYAIKKLSGPEYFINLYDKFYHPDAKIIPSTVTNQVPRTDLFQSYYKKIRLEWGNHKTAIITLLEDPALDGRIYGSSKAVDKQIGMTKRALKLLQIEKDIDALLTPDMAVSPLIQAIELVSQTKLQNSTLKNQNPPAHEFFNLCDEFLNASKKLCLELDQYLMALEYHFFEYAQNTLELKKKENHELSFDDLLIIVRDALRSDNGNILSEILRKKYSVALIDEFQDTDSIQYEIFSTLFSKKDHTLFMIGDPKQAIYGFRGADIFSYMKAVDQTKDAHTLLQNWRSTPSLIAAVNTIFSNRNPSFLYNKIPFKTVLPGRAMDPEKKESGAALTIWHLFSHPEAAAEKSLSVEQATRIIAKAVTGEIAKITSQNANPILPKDIAVLVRTNRQAGIVMKHLFEKNITSVLFNSGNIFDTSEALELQRILWGLADPGNERKLKAALATELLGMKGIDFEDYDSEGLWEKRVSRMRYYAMIWKKQGFMRMFRLLITEENIKLRLMRFPDGERRVTNILHLGELLHHAEIEKEPGILGLVKWLSEKRERDFIESDDHLLRLEKDEHAVRIITIHKSKGLEYPVVFCPFGWENSLVQDKPAIQYHDPSNNYELVVDLGSECFETHKILAQREKLAENIRLYYVALTRAKEKCYLVWGPIKTAETSAPAYLFHLGRNYTESDRPDIVTEIKDVIFSKTHAQLLEDLRHVEKRSSGTIELIDIPDQQDIPQIKKQKDEDTFFYRHFTGNVDRSWKVTSYSNLTETHEDDSKLRDRDRLSPFLSFGFDLNVSEDQPTVDFSNINHFPKGTQAGLFFHDLFETLDFINFDTTYRNLLISKKLKQFGFSLDWQQAIGHMMENVMSVSLLSDQPDIKLSEISFESRINEMEFYYPIQVSTPNIIMDLLNNDKTMELNDREEKFIFSPIRGFMRGFVDMIFMHNGKYYIIDWKSNFLGQSPEYYSKKYVKKAMYEHQYHVQYLIYTLALHQYLSKRIVEYDYAKHFGGVFYMFIRGISPKYGPDFGIFYDLPDSSKIQKMANNLIS